MDILVTQTVHFGTCEKSSVDGECSNSRTAEGQCGQQYTMRDMLIYEPSRKAFSVETFDIPFSCVCLARFNMRRTW